MILEVVKKTIRELGLLQPEERILIAYSGGADSSALLHLLLELREEWSFKLFLGHFNHKLRPGAEEDERFVRSVARKYSLPLYVGRGDVRARAEASGLNIEEAGRKLRYDFLCTKASEIGRAKVATGHTLTDQAETLLMRLMRGSGLRGLAGIFPVKDDVIVRPLLQVEREDVEAFLRERKIEFRVDESNFDRRFLRNRIRLELLPYLKRNFEPAIVQHLGRIAAIIREEDRVLDELTREKAREAIVGKNAGASLDLQFLSSLPRALARRIIREFITGLRGSLRKISFQDVESVLTLADGKEYSLKEHLVLRREGNRVFLKKKARPVQYEYQWSGKEPLEIKRLRLRFTGKKFKKKKASSLRFDDRTQACLDLKKLKFPLQVRNRLEGDRYRPLGAPGQKKVKEIMRARGIPLSERGKYPVFLSKDRIVWILGLPVSDRFKIIDETTDIFQIKKL
jgi:tRNA(Ile)-lysidine synthase